MAHDRSDRTKPDEGKTADLESCLRDSPHLHTIVGRMQQTGVPLLSVSGQTDHGVPWAGIVVQGQQADLLQQVAEVVAAHIEADRVRRRDEARRG